MNAEREALDMLRAKAAEHDEICVGFTGGKDSLVCLDLCCRTFKRVRAFYMQFIPGLASDAAKLAVSKERWGVSTMLVPHWKLFHFLRSGIYCDVPHGREKLRRLEAHELYLMACEGMDKPLVVIGAKKSDSMWRRRTFRAKFSREWMLAPLADWTKKDVLSYLDRRGIPLPEIEAGGFQQSGLDLSTPEVLRLHDNHPDDYAKLLEWFPYAACIVERRTMFGVS